MTRRALVMALAAAMGMAACQDEPAPGASNTAVLGSSGPPRAKDVIPAPPMPRGAHHEIAFLPEGEALAVWEHGGDILVAHYWPIAGWQPPRKLEDIGGQSSLPRIASNGAGTAMAVWQHTVGRIESLRYSRYVDGRGWSRPDVMPGALPRPRQPGKTAGASVESAAVQLEVDPQGNARAQWPSGFAEGEFQVSTFVPHEGWSRPVDIPVASAR